jgi:hypothetical protein
MAMNDEATALLERLEGQRRHVLGILEGLSTEDLHRPVLPTRWSCLGLVQHLTFDVERFWFRQVTGGETISEAELAGDPANAWQVSPDISPETVLDRFRAEIARANEVITRTRWAPTQPGGPRACSVTGTRETYVASSCTSSPRPPVTPATSTPRAS